MLFDIYSLTQDSKKCRYTKNFSYSELLLKLKFRPPWQKHVKPRLRRSNV